MVKATGILLSLLLTVTSGVLAQSVADAAKAPKNSGNSQPRCLEKTISIRCGRRRMPRGATLIRIQLFAMRAARTR